MTQLARTSVVRFAGSVLTVACLLLLAACGSSTDVPATISRFHRLLILGNSITLHGPSPEIGWTGDWGMAATSASRDYAHIVAAQIPDAALEIRNISTLETNPALFGLHSLDSSLAQSPDLVIVELGDNVRDVSAFRTAYGALIDRITAVRPAALVCTTTWWGNSDVDSVIRSACNGTGEHVVAIHTLYLDSLNRAAAEHASLDSGLAIHPGDRGMAQLAEAMLRAIAP